MDGIPGTSKLKIDLDRAVVNENQMIDNHQLLYKHSIILDIINFEIGMRPEN